MGGIGKLRRKKNQGRTSCFAKMISILGGKGTPIYVQCWSKTDQRESAQNPRWVRVSYPWGTHKQKVRDKISDLVRVGKSSWRAVLGRRNLKGDEKTCELNHKKNPFDNPIGLGEPDMKRKSFKFTSLNKWGNPVLGMRKTMGFFQSTLRKTERLTSKATSTERSKIGREGLTKP